MTILFFEPKLIFLGQVNFFLLIFVPKFKIYFKMFKILESGGHPRSMYSSVTSIIYIKLLSIWIDLHYAGCEALTRLGLQLCRCKP